MSASGRFPRDEKIQGRLPPHDAVNQLLAEAPVLGREMSASEGGFEKILHEIRARSSALQNLRSNLSWFLLDQFV